ncbi:MAG: inosine/xanthosine triphosphatase [Candidatus Hodarchaeota archaeon]
MGIEVLVVSKNPVKIRAAQEAFSSFYEKLVISNIEISEIDPTGVHVKTQPLGEEQTYETSRWRVNSARDHRPGFDFYVGIEGGVVLTRNNPRIIVYSSVSNNSFIETIRGCEIPLPQNLYTQLINSPNSELGDLITNISGISNIKQKEGAVGFFTRKIVTRFDILKQSVIMALIPFLNPNLFEITKG